MALAGLWEGFKWSDGTVLRTFTIITTDANETVGELHNRMPVILEQQDWPTWLGEVEGDPAIETDWRGCAEGLAGQQAGEQSTEQWGRVVGASGVIALVDGSATYPG